MTNKYLRNASGLLKHIKNILILIGQVLISLFDEIIILIGRLRNKAKEIKKQQDFSSLKKILDKMTALKAPTLSVRKKVKKNWVPGYKEVEYKPRKTTLRILVRRFLIFFSGVLFAVIFLLIPSHVLVWLHDLPNPDLLVTRQIPTPTRILDRNGRLLYEIFIEKRYEPVKIKQIPQHMIDATIAVEDAQFYTHAGFEPKSMLRAAKSTFVDNNLQGGSTITQQLIKNVLLSPERTISRKLKELVLSVAAEARYSKAQILELYLNNISYGGSAWGIQSAAQKFFAKNVWELDLAEAALLAGLPTAPTTYSPLTGNFEVAKQRQKYVLDRMKDLGYITKQEAEDAYAEELIFAPQTEYIRAPHFVAYVRKDLEERFGKNFVDLGGLTVTTTLDLDLQEEVQRIVKEEVEKNARLKISNGAAVVLDSKTGEILAYVGSIDYFKENWGAFDVITSYRQPGSSIKPVTYALALENGYTAASILKDEPVSYKIKGQPDYTPRNYDGKYHGNVTVRQALSNSYNIPAVRLAKALGPDNIVAFGKRFGLTNWEVDGSYGLSVTLGGKEVRLLDHTNLYAALARQGNYLEPTPYLSIVDGMGFDVYKDERQPQKVINEGTAYILWSILSDSVSRLPAFGPNNYLDIPGKTVAVKTGTTDQIKDNFTLGFTPSYTTGVWVGNNDGTPLDRSLASGLSGAAPMWNRIMTLVLKDKGDEKMVMPSNVFMKYDESCKKSEVFIKGSKVPDHLCAVKDDKKDKNGENN